MNATPELTTRGKGQIIDGEVKEHRNWFLVVGVVMVVLGIAAIAFPFVATLAVDLLIGWILTLSGAVGVVHAIRNAKWRGFAWSLLGALLSLGVGVVLLFYPITGVLSLTLLMAAFFIAGGVFRVLLALRLRPLDNWGWLLISGLLALVLAGLILAQWPEAAAWVLGLLVGIDLLFAGWTAILLAMAARRSV